MHSQQLRVDVVSVRFIFFQAHGQRETEDWYFLFAIAHPWPSCAATRLLNLSLGTLRGLRRARRFSPLIMPRGASPASRIERDPWMSRSRRVTAY